MSAPLVLISMLFTGGGATLFMLARGTFSLSRRPVAFVDTDDDNYRTLNIPVTRRWALTVHTPMESR